MSSCHEECLRQERTGIKTAVPARDRHRWKIGEREEGK
eukprot:gene26308-biopygen15744